MLNYSKWHTSEAFATPIKHSVLLSSFTTSISLLQFDVTLLNSSSTLQLLMYTLEIFLKKIWWADFIFFHFILIRGIFFIFWGWSWAFLPSVFVACHVCFCSMPRVTVCHGMPRVIPGTFGWAACGRFWIAPEGPFTPLLPTHMREDCFLATP